MFVNVGMRTDEHSLRSQVGIESESDCFVGSGQLERILRDFLFGCRPKRREIWRCCRWVEESEEIQYWEVQRR